MIKVYHGNKLVEDTSLEDPAIKKQELIESAKNDPNPLDIVDATYRRDRDQK
ncbi:hypothetical protein FACS189428_3850 [Clostridia bacterium]|nr:hypothetical protein FACS189428_3850 [Clostridia bacterium]